MSNRSVPKRPVRRPPTHRGPGRRSAVRRGRGGGANRWLFPAVVGVIVVAGILAVVLTVAGGGDSGTSAEAEVSAEVSVDGTALPRSTGAAKDAAVGLAAPTLGSIDFQARNVSVGGATGEPYVLAFLAHWCPHCQAEVPRIVAVEKAGKASGVPVIAVATGTDKTYPNYPPSAWFAREDWQGTVLLDDGNDTAAVAFGLQGYPYLVFVDAQGKVAARTSGEIPETELESMLAELAAGQPVTVPRAGASSNAK